METQRKERRENVAAGIVGAFLGALLGVVCTIFIGQMGYIASISGLVMAVGALKGYELLGGALSKKGAVISSVLILGMTYLAHQLSTAFSINSELGLGLVRSFESISPMLQTGLLDGKVYWGNLVMLYLFTLLGAVPTIIGGLRTAGMPDMPQSAFAAQGELPEVALYPGSTAWMRPLRLSAAASMFLGLIPAVALIFYSAANSTPMAPTLAALGCVAACFIMICFAMPSVQLCNRAMNLMVRSGKTVWRVTLPMLNNADTYRFTKQTGAFRPIRWETLNGTEREQLKISIQRAIALLTSGQVMPGSALGMAVMPLPNLQITKETPWAWKGTYQGKNGGEKKISIPKAYEGFAPAPGLEPAQEPPPARWSMPAAGAALALALALAAGGLAWAAEGGPSRPSPKPAVPSPAPSATLRPQPSAAAQPDPRDLFHIGSELGYQYTAVGYIKAPDGMFSQNGSYVDAHVPYSENPLYLEDGHAIRSAAHGMEVTVRIAQTQGDARDVVDQAYELLAASGADIYEEGVQDTQYFEEYDIAVKQVSCFEENRTKVRVLVLYADYKQEGYYLSASIVYQPELMDADCPALLAELSDAYALNLPDIPPMDQM